MLDLTQLLRVPHVDTELPFDLSPTGEKAAFAWNGSGNWEIYEMSLRGAERQSTSAPDRDSLAKEGIAILSTGPGSKFAPQYSPDGRSLAYALDLDGSESYHIVLHDLITGVSQDLTPGSGYAQQPNFAFSPDGKLIAILSDQGGQFALYAMRSSGGEANLLMDIHRPCWNVRWSPDGKWICVEAETTASDRGLFVVSVKVRDSVQICENGRALNAQHAAWSPDGKMIAFSGENGEWHNIGLYDIESGKVSWVNPTEGDDDRPCWSPDGSRLGWMQSAGAKTSLVLRERSGALHSHQVGTGLHLHPRFTKDGHGLVCIFESPSQPPDLWILDLEDNTFQQLTDSLPTELQNTRFIQPEEVRYSSGEGVMIPALLYRAAEGKSAVVNIHGGPNWLFQFMWHPLMSHMASRGWTVLAPNYRGSTGYGRRWQAASRFDMGGVDARDCAAGATYLVEMSLADKDKIAITGRSHGGYLTMSCMTLFPELWAGGSAVVPFLNWLSSHYASREDLQHWNIENMGDPQEARELWIERSPYYFLDKISSPVQLICGANDPRCPATDSIAARDKLKELGREVELLLYEEEGHTFLATNNLIDSEIKRVEFLARILQTQTPPQTGDQLGEE